MRAQFPILLTFAALLQACAVHEEHSYRISRATHIDAAKARQIIREVAAEAGIPGDTGEKYAHESLANYRLLNVSLEAFISDDHIDVYLARSDWPRPQAFVKADMLLAPALSAAFGRRFNPHKDERVIVTALNGPNRALQPTVDRPKSFHMTASTLQYAAQLALVGGG